MLSGTWVSISAECREGAIRSWVAVGDQRRRSDAGEVLKRGTSPGPDGCDLPEEGRQADGFVAVHDPFLQPSEVLRRGCLPRGGPGEEDSPCTGILTDWCLHLSYLDSRVFAPVTHSLHLHIHDPEEVRGLSRGESVQQRPPLCSDLVEALAGNLLVLAEAVGYGGLSALASIAMRRVRRRTCRPFDTSF